MISHLLLIVHLDLPSQIKTSQTSIESCGRSGTPRNGARSASLKDFLIPVVTSSEQKMIDKNIAMFFYKTGTSFLRIEDENLKKAFNVCRPGKKSKKFDYLSTIRFKFI